MGLKIASDIFFKESLNFPNQNFHYRFGDPVLKSDGSYKYPELVKYFERSGETYAESVSRIFNAVVQMSKKVKKLNSSVEVVIVSHGFTYHVLRGLSILSEKIRSGEVKIRTGEIPLQLSQIYESRVRELRDTAFAPIDITNLGDQGLIKILNDEIQFLKKKQKND